MSRQSITEKIWYDPDGTNYVMLDVTEKIPPQTSRTIDGVELHPKDEYHVTLVPAGRLSDDPTEVAAIINDITTYLRANRDGIGCTGIGEEYYVCQKDGEATMIVSARITGIEGLRTVVQTRVPSYQPAFPHVTLLKSANSEYGIAVNSIDDLENRCRRIEL